ncbi:hypothetical protein AVEN_197916-1 [Araneus ventricosus]|uniref:STPR domain-containing protein n=1 Tax=Araneus ventricosus TaxID=182803 RepID=A0A4Y2CMI5_ARAVE|nr:hypothetical protein AVEN_197916-1 [Araneus ventricosus]
MAQRAQKRRAEETKEKRNSRLSDMAQRVHERRAEETEEQRNTRLSAMVQHARDRHLNVIEGRNHHQIQNCSLLLIYLGENVGNVFRYLTSSLRQGMTHYSTSPVQTPGHVYM